MSHAGWAIMDLVASLAAVGIVVVGFLSNAQVAVSAGPLVPLYWIFGPAIALLLALAIWAVKALIANTVAMAVFQNQITEIAALRKWKHETEQWRQEFALLVGLLKEQHGDHEKQLVNLHRRMEQVEWGGDRHHHHRESDD